MAGIEKFSPFSEKDNQYPEKKLVVLALFSDNYSSDHNTIEGHAE
jgi:hypothetical protein